MKWIEKIYSRSPVPFQDLMVSCYGLYLHRLRYGGGYKDFFRKIQDSQWWSREKILEFQDRELARLIRFAAAEVPYYRELLQRLGLGAESIQCRADLVKLPVLRKPDIRDREKDLLARSARRRSLVEGHTSGTTGTSLTFYKSPETIQRTWAFVERARNWVGLSYRDRRASFGVRVVVPRGASGPPFSRYNWAERQRMFSIYDISPETAGAYYQELKEFRPVFIDSYPSAICTVAAFMKERGQGGIRPRAIITLAETLLDHQRKLLEEQFRCPVYDWYGTAESAVHAMQCERGTYHICSEYGIVEILGEDGNPVNSGEEGEIVATCFVNDAFPFIRYGTGDRGVVSDRVCSCGRGLEVLEKVLGRKDDVIVRPDGKLLGRLDVVFKDTHHIRESQILQEEIDRITVLVVPDSRYSPADTEHLLKNLRYFMGDVFDFDIRLVEKIERTSAGKYRSVVSRLKRGVGGRGN